MDPIEIVDVETRRWSAFRERVVVFGSIGLVVALLASVALLVDRGSGSSDNGITVQEIETAGPYDGLESIGLPVCAEPDVGLVDNQVVRVEASGFEPGSTVAIVQCWVVNEQGSERGCDTGGYDLTHANDQGQISADFVVRRFISIEGASVDCALGGLVEGCRVAAADINDYDISGSAPTFFDPDVEGVVAPIVVIDSTDGLVDGQLLTIRGSEFPPGDTLRVTQCVIGGGNGMPGCFGLNPTGHFEAASDGTFEVVVTASRLVQGSGRTIDCAQDPYGCRLVVAGTRTPNPTHLTYDASFRAPDDIEFTITPNRIQEEPATIRVDGFDIRAHGPLTLAQCVDQGPEGVWCQSEQAVELESGGFSVSLDVSRWIWNGGGEAINCAGPGRTCFVQIGGVSSAANRIPIYFETSEEPDEPRPVPVLVGYQPIVAGMTSTFDVEGSTIGWSVQLCVKGVGSSLCDIELLRVPASAAILSVPDDLGRGGAKLRLVPTNMRPPDAELID